MLHPSSSRWCLYVYRLPELTDLDWRYTMFTDTGLTRLLRAFPRVTKLCLSHAAKITGSGFDQCSSVPLLRHLNLNHCPINQPGLKALAAKVPNIDTLIVSDNHRMGKTAIDLMATTRFGFRQLSHLDISVH